MITDEELADLPDDPEHAFVLYERRIRERLHKDLEISENQYAVESCQITYMSHVLAAVKALDLGILGNWTVPSTSDDVNTYYRNFVTEVDGFTVQFRFRHARRVKQFSVAFDAAAKAKLRHHLEQMREVVDRLDVPDRKREALINRITALNDEIDRDRTRFEAFAALVVETSDQMEPLRKWIEPIAGIFRKSKEIEQEREPPRLPSPPKRIGGPKQPQAPQRKKQVDLDDDVPF
jgi:hypothetical protein